MKNSYPNPLDVLKKGAFSIRHIKKDYCKSAVDLSLDETVNRDAATKMKGIVSFQNYVKAMRRWSLTMTVTDLRTFAGIELGENATAQCRSSRIIRHSSQMAALGTILDKFCNPFMEDAPTSLMNLTTG